MFSSFSDTLASHIQCAYRVGVALLNTVVGNLTVLIDIFVTSEKGSH